MKNIILASTSTMHGSEFLSYLLDELEVLYKGVGEVLFIPYAKPSGISYAAYTKLAKQAFNKIDIKIVGIHEYDDPVSAIENAKGFYVGGGNTFTLVDTLYKNNAMATLKKRIENGIPYLGTSAGSNICGLTMQTTNDMPIVYPPSFKTMGCISYNLNVHYLEVDPNSTHKGESREVRIKEFQATSPIPVIGLREGSWLELKNNQLQLKGNLNAVLFKKNKKTVEIAPLSIFN